MKKRLLSLLICAMLVSVYVGCGAESTITEQSETTATTATEDATPEAIEETHTHNYTEEITTVATCEADGLKTFSCECGDTYTEAIPAAEHIYENYVSNNDATYTSDGTETAKCNTCDLTDTRTAEGSKLEYTYTEMNATMYATQTVNVRDLPTTDGNKVGSLSTNDEVAVTGTCNETGWYRIVYGDGVAYISNKYLGDSKVEVSAPPVDNSGGGNSNTPAGVPNPFTVERRVVHDMGVYRFVICSFYDYDAIYKLNPYGAQGNHLNTSEDLWVFYECSNYYDPGYRAFIDTYTCNCSDADHNGLYPERLGN